MALYHFSVKAISRADGRSVVACAAYRAGEKLTCEYYGKEQDYTKKQAWNLPIFMRLKIQNQCYLIAINFGIQLKN